MNILLVNDDGYLAQGINELKAALSSFANVIMLAPDKEYSATGHRIRLEKLLAIEKIEENSYYLNSTPADCVRVALSGAISYFPKFDLVISGINHGPNLGIDVYYSGTLAAARESIFNGVPSIGFSLCAFDNNQRYFFTEAAYKAKELIENLAKAQFLNDPHFYLNVNFPNLENIKGFKATHCGERFYGLKCEEIKTYNDQEKYVLVDFPLDNTNVQTHEDFMAVSEGYISITPLKIDITDNEKLKQLKQTFNL